MSKVKTKFSLELVFEHNVHILTLGFLNLRESREDEITVQGCNSSTIPKEIMSQEEVLERIEVRQTVTEYNISHTLELWEEKQHVQDKQRPPPNNSLDKGKNFTNNFYFKLKVFYNWW